MTSQSEPQSQRSYGWLIFGLVAIAGLFYVKWFPYYHRAFTAETTHSIGKSILMGRAASPPAPSFTAALEYARTQRRCRWCDGVLAQQFGPQSGQRWSSWVSCWAGNGARYGWFWAC